MMYLTNFAAAISLVLFVIVGIIGIIMIIYGLATDGEPLNGLFVFLFVFVPTLIIWLLNLFCFPGKEMRYVPSTKVAVSREGSAATENTSDVPVDETLYLQIRISVMANSLARDFFHDNQIPVTVSLSDPDVADYTVQQSRNFEEIKPPESDSNSTSYFFAVYAAEAVVVKTEPDDTELDDAGYAVKRKTEPDDADVAIITLRGKAKKAGSQTVRVRYGGKVSGKYERTVTVDYK